MFCTTNNFNWWLMTKIIVHSFEKKILFEVKPTSTHECFLRRLVKFFLFSRWDGTNFQSQCRVLGLLSLERFTLEVVNVCRNSGSDFTNKELRHSSIPSLQSVPELAHTNLTSPRCILSFWYERSRNFVGLLQLSFDLSKNIFNLNLLHWFLLGSGPCSFYNLLQAR